MVLPLAWSSNARQGPGSLKGRRVRSLALMKFSHVVQCPCFVVFLAAVMLWPPGSGTCRTLMWLNVVRPRTTVAAEELAGTGEAELPEIPLGTADNMENFTVAIAARVKIVAEKAQANHADRCGMLDNCTTGNHLSRLACGYHQGDNYTCVDGYDFDPSLCTLDGKPDNKGKPCTQLKQSFEQTFVRYPLVDGLQHTVNRIIIQDTCTQTPLHGVFQSSLDLKAFQHSGGLYFGSVSGVHWGLPGLNQFIDPDSKFDFPFYCREKTLIYDPRHRPWFKQASSPKKQVSVLVDLRNDMGGTVDDFFFAGPYYKMKKIDAVRNTLKELAKTFQESDDVALTTFPPCSSTTDMFHQDRPDNLKFFKSALEAMAPADHDPTQDLADGIKCALDPLVRIQASDKIQILLVFTRGSVNVENAISYIKSYQPPVFVFFYGVELHNTSAAFLNLSTIASAVNGVARTLKYGDPLLSVYSYFDFLASFYRRTEEPYFCREYIDAFNLKNITTMILPVYDYEGHFYGVAGMDIRHQANPGAKGKLSDLAKQGSPERDRSIESVQGALNLTNCTQDPCYDEMPLPQCNNDRELSFKDVLFYAEDYKPQEGQIMCCPGCLPKPDPKQALFTRWWFITAVVVGGLLASTLVIGCMVIVRRRCNHCSGCSCFTSVKKDGPQPNHMDIITVPYGKH